MSEAIQITQAQDEIEVRTDIEAGWQLERRKKIIEDRDELIAYYKAQIKAVEEDADFKLGFIDRSLYAFFLTKEHKKTKTEESVTLPGGKMMLKAQEPEYKRDEQKVIEWLKKTPETLKYIKVKEELDWSSLKSDTTVVGNTIVNTDGEVIPGVEVVAREPKFTITNTKKKV